MATDDQQVRVHVFDPAEQVVDPRTLVHIMYLQAVAAVAIERAGGKIEFEWAEFESIQARMPHGGVQIERDGETGHVLAFMPPTSHDGGRA